MKHSAFISTVLTLCLALLLTACGGSTAVNSNPLSYDDIRGTGLANNCPQLTGTNMDSIEIDANQPYQLKELCLEPEVFLVKRTSPTRGKSSAKRNDKTEKYIESKLLTRKSFTLDQVNGKLIADSNGRLTFVEQGGFDFQPVTIQLPNGERVPLLFTVKGLVANSQDAVTAVGPSTRLAGNFNVPPYRTSSFIDPKGRGIAVGYDAAVGIPIQADREKFSRQNAKSFEIDKGQIVLQINQVNRATGELSGQFESQQPSDTEFGAKESMTVKVQGQFYGRITSEIV